MTDKMTLQQTLSFFRSVIQSGEPWTKTCESAYSEAMAHLAAMGEPVAEVQQREPYLDGSPNPMKQLKWTLPNCEDDLPVGTKLYLVPPASGDWDAVRHVAARIRWKGEYGLDARAAVLVEWADKLAAALPENAK